MNNKLQIINKYDNIKFIIHESALDTLQNVQSIKQYENVFWIVQGMDLNENQDQNLSQLLSQIKMIFFIDECSPKEFRILDSFAIQYKKNISLENAIINALMIGLKQSIKSHIIFSHNSQNNNLRELFAEIVNKFVADPASYYNEEV